jgi:CRISPR-associated endonuclease/helicase Cas3
MPLNFGKVRSCSKTTFPVVPFDRCAAKSTDDDKPGTTVLDHCRNVGCVARELAKLHPASLRTRLPLDPGLAVGVHDVGKVSPGFMLKYFKHTLVKEHASELAGKTSFSTNHAAIGAAALDRWLGIPPMTAPVAIAAAAHHGSADRGYPPDTAETLGGSSWAEERRKLIEALTAYFGGTLDDAAQAHPGLLAGLVCVADWIGSCEDFFPADRPPVRNDDPQATAQHAVSFCGFEPSAIRGGLSFNDIFDFSPRRAQSQFIEQVHKPGVYVLEAPMGIGKTEAALYAIYRLMEAGHHRGFYFALPTRLTSDRIHERVSAFLERITDSARTPRLAHGMAWLREFARGGEEFKPGESWFNPMKRALLHPYAVGTIDQALLSVLNVRHGFVRLYGLAGKAVVLDEVHSYDVYTGTLLDELVERLRGIGCTVVILSATLTAARRHCLAPGSHGIADTQAYPLMTSCPEGEATTCLALEAPANIEVAIRMEHWDAVCMAKEAAQAARRGLCVVCIANTVAQAQSWYRTVQSERREGDFETGLLHARFPLSRRTAIEEHWMKALGRDEDQRPKGCILVATQILEQSVDIDADWMISELAPSDMLLQRMGRLWRHVRDIRPCARPELTILTGDPTDCNDRDAVAEALGKENCCVYAPYVLVRTHAVWKSLRIIGLPKDIRNIIEDTYADSSAPESDILRKLRKHLAERSEKLRRMAFSAKDNVQGIPTSPDDEQRAPTRYSDLPTRSVLLLAHAELVCGREDRAQVRLLDGSELELNCTRPDYKATRRLHQWTVSIASHCLPERGMVRQNCRWLDRHFSDKPLVLILSDDGRLHSFKGPETMLGYSEELGVWRETKRANENDSEEEGDFDPFSMQW